MRKLLAIAALAAAPFTQAIEQRDICIYDPLGTSGPLYGLMKDYREFALMEGYEIKLHGYTDEKIASDDFKAGQCDGVLISGARARPYSKFMSTVEAIGAVPTNDIMKQVVNMVSTPNAAKYMSNDRYEVGGVLPGGPLYLFVNDRSIDTVEELSGKRLATLDYDEPSVKMVNHVGAALVPSNSANFGAKFNNGSVDIAYGPAIAFKPLELYKGLGDKGAIVRFNLAYLDFQLVLKKSEFGSEYAQKSRTYIASKFDNVIESIERETAAIDAKYWLDLSAEDKARYNEMFRQVRVVLRDEGVYDGRMLKLLKKLRCKDNPSAAECVQNLE